MALTASPLASDRKHKNYTRLQGPAEMNEYHSEGLPLLEEVCDCPHLRPRETICIQLSGNSSCFDVYSRQNSTLAKYSID